MYDFLEKLSDMARLPSKTEFHVIAANFHEAIAAAPRPDINIFGLGENLSFDFIRDTTDLAHSSCLFVKDSGMEDALV